MVSRRPAGSSHPVTAKALGAFPGEAATQMVSSTWLTNVTWRWPSRTGAAPAAVATPGGLVTTRTKARLNIATSTAGRHLDISPSVAPVQV